MQRDRPLQYLSLSPTRIPHTRRRTCVARGGSNPAQFLLLYALRVLYSGEVYIRYFTRRPTCGGSATLAVGSVERYLAYLMMMSFSLSFSSTLPSGCCTPRSPVLNHSPCTNHHPHKASKQTKQPSKNKNKNEGEQGRCSFYRTPLTPAACGSARGRKGLTIPSISCPPPAGTCSVIKCIASGDVDHSSQITFSRELQHSSTTVSSVSGHAKRTRNRAHPRLPPGSNTTYIPISTPI